MITTVAPFNPVGPMLAKGEMRDGKPIVVELVLWGVRRLGPGVWAVLPSLNIEGEGGYHGYVVMHDVPEPAPWTVAIATPANEPL